jgi:hypothetical protein
MLEFWLGFVIWFLKLILLIACCGPLQEKQDKAGVNHIEFEVQVHVYAESGQEDPALCAV